MIEMKKIFYAILSSLVVFMVIISMNKIRYQYDWRNALWRTVMTPFTGTLWADGFSDERFAKISIGMPKEEVEKILGSPLSVGCEKMLHCDGVYSYQDSGTADFDRRWIRFGWDGRVVEIVRDFYID